MHVWMCLFQEIVKGGITVSGSFNYQATLDLNGNNLLPQGPSEFCLRLLHGWPGNKLTIYTFYQIRSAKMCYKDIPYVSHEYVYDHCDHTCTLIFL